MAIGSLESVVEKLVSQPSLRIVVDVNSGEIVEQDGVFISRDEIREQEENLNKRRDYFKNLSDGYESVLIQLYAENKRLRNCLGKEIANGKMFSKFVWFYFKEGSDLFPELKGNDITRLAYLATYCEYKTNVLVECGKPMTEKRLKVVMNLDGLVFKPWLEKVTKFGYITFKGDKIVLNKKYFGKGRMPSLRKGEKAVRIFVKPMRELYSGLCADDHQKLGFVFKLMPHMNLHFNCLAENPWEVDINKLTPLRISKIAELMSYSPKSCRRIIDGVREITYGTNKEKIVNTVKLNKNLEKGLLTFNSKLFFGGKAEDSEFIEGIPVDLG